MRRRIRGGGVDLEVTPDLLQSIKDRIKVTWSHQDEAIKEMIKEGMAAIQGKTGPIAFSENTILSINARKILKEYVRYDWNGVLASFEIDYLSDILELQMLAAVGRRRGSNEK